LTPLYRRWREALGLLKLRMTMAGVAALLLGIGVITLVLVQHAERDMLTDQRERELQEAIRTASVLSSRVLELQRGLRVSAEQLDEATLHDAAALERFFHDRVVLRHMFSHVIAATSDGQVRAYADRNGVRPMPINVADRAYFRQTMAEGRPVISEVIPSRAVHEPVLVLTQPLRGSQGVFGIVNGTLWLRSGELMAPTVPYQGSSDPGALLVVTDAHGRILAHPDTQRVMESLSNEPQLGGVWAGWLQLGRRLESAGVSLAQPGAVVSVAGVAGPDWLVWRLLPEARLLAPLHAARRHALQWAAVMVLATSLVLLALVHWLLQPMRLLERRAQHLFDTQQDPHTGWPATGGEIGRLSDVLQHVSTERAQLEASNTALMRQLQCVMAAAPVGIAFTRDDRLELANAELCRLFGRTLHELVGGSVARMCLDPMTRHKLMWKVHRGLAHAQGYHGEWQLRRGDGDSFWAAVGVRLADEAGPLQGLIWTVSDISAQVAAREKLRWLASHDPLTELANRVTLEEHLAQVVAAVPRAPPAALVAIDLDCFKPVNDSAGHAAGDAMLKAVAQALRSCVRADDMVVRVGGDEFVLLLQRCPPERALRIAQSACTAVQHIELDWNGYLLRVGASAGVAILEPHMTQAAQWLSAADQACYEAKAAGRGHARAARPVPPDKPPPDIRAMAHAPSLPLEPAPAPPPWRAPAPCPMSAAGTGYTAQGVPGVAGRRRFCLSCEHWLDNHCVA
jgi:diguanylate cyclase (GGDEF)-like protein/PAS domain S-box-containing protein